MVGATEFIFKAQVFRGHITGNIFHGGWIEVVSVTVVHIVASIAIVTGGHDIIDLVTFSWQNWQQ